MLDVLRALLCAAGTVYVVIRLIGFLRSLAEGVISSRPDKHLATQRRNVAESAMERTPVSSSPFSD